MVELAYIGVHEIFQMAIAANELGCLSGLQCSLFDAPGKTGQWLGRFLQIPSAHPLGSEDIPPHRVHEIPLPQIARQVQQRWIDVPRLDPLFYHKAFERTAAKRLRRQDVKACIAVGAETCALRFFEEARRQKMKCVLDSHGIPAPFLDQALRRAAQEFGLSAPPPCDSPAMQAHKERERELADIIVFCSDLQKDIWIDWGVASTKCRAIPLWVDTSYWCRNTPLLTGNGPLRVAAVGCGSLAKGLPYLLRAVEPLSSAIQLTLVGNLHPSMRPLLAAQSMPPARLPYLTRSELRDFLGTQDLLVMPSLGDSFGFVAIEAMACGLPVVVTSHCGVPVPHSDWRVQAHDSSAITNRILHYLDSPSSRLADAYTAQSFAAQFSPQRYRDQIKAIYRELLG